MKIIKKIFGEYRWFLVFPVLVQLLINVMDPDNILRYLLQGVILLLVPILTIVLVFQKQSRGFRGTIVLGFLFWVPVVLFSPGWIRVDV